MSPGLLLGQQIWGHTSDYIAGTCCLGEKTMPTWKWKVQGQLFWVESAEVSGRESQAWGHLPHSL